MATKQRKQPAPKQASQAPKGAEVRVHWIDAAFDLDKAPKLAHMRTYGQIIKHDSKELIIASEGCDDDVDYYRSFTTIPAGWIISIQKLIPAA